jgi:CMP/dCMP kinase
VARRDRLDSTRAASPLEVADGAKIVDTTGRSIEAVVEEVLAWL